MRLLIIFARQYPWRGLLMLGCLLLAALAEGIGLSTLLPLLGMVGDTADGGRLKPPDPNESTLERIVREGLAAAGFEPTVGVLLLMMVLGITIKAGLVLLAKRQIGYTVAHVATDLRLSFLRAMLKARWEYYIRQPVGGLANAFATEASRASEAYLYGATIVSLSIEALLYTVLGTLVSWQATLGAASASVLTVLTFSRLVKKTRKAGNRQTDLMKTLIGRLTDVLYSVKPLKAMARENLIGPLLEAETHQLNRALRRQVLSKEAVRALQEPLLVAALAVGLYVALTYWAMTMNSVVLLILFFSRALINVNRIQKQYQNMAGCESAFWSLSETISRSEDEREVAAGDARPVLNQAIHFDGVSFSYGDHPVLDDVSFKIEAGKLTGLVGPSGAGKTSIADLMIGLVNPSKGEVRIDETSLADVNLEAWRQSVGYVPQETFLLHENVLVNVSLGDPELTEADVEEALRAAGAWDFVSALPDGMLTPLGERGARVSGGQRQRIAIARALAHKPQLLILDEATASLDGVSETEIYDTVLALRGQVTVFAISHQPALLEAADAVYVLDSCKIRLAPPNAAAPEPT